MALSEKILTERQVSDASTIWRPINASHAIENVFAGIIFSQPLTSVVWKRANEAAKDLAGRIGLVEEAPIQQFRFVIAPLSPEGLAPPSSSPAGMEFFRRTPNGQIPEKLSLSPDNLRLDSWAYTRWVGFEEKLRSTLEALFDIYTSAVVVRTLSLEYTDVFLALEAGEADSTLIIDQSSDCIAKTPISKSSQWHSHTGWFEDETSATRRLLNVDVTVGDANTPEGVRRSVTIRSHHALQFSPGTDGTAESQNLTIDDMLTKFNQMHVDLKNRLGAVLTSAAEQMISLKDSSDV